jgi:hypothetical protein
VASAQQLLQQMASQLATQSISGLVSNIGQITPALSADAQGLLTQFSSSPIGALSGATETVSFTPQRSIGGIVADVTIQEVGTDELEITENPVEGGAAITDHSYSRPPELIIKTGFSNSSDAAGGSPTYSMDTYQSFLDLQASREPMEVVTGKRTYENMLIRSIVTPTDVTSENAFMATITLKQIIIVQTAQTTIPATSQANPAQTGSIVSSGPKQTVPASPNQPALATVLNV